MSLPFRQDPAPPTEIWNLVHKVLDMAVGLCRTVAEVNDTLRENRAAIDELEQERPDLWNALKVHTKTHRTRLQKADPTPQRNTP